MGRAVARAPQRVGEHDGPGRALAIVGGRKTPAEGGADSEEFEELVGNRRHRDAFRLAPGLGEIHLEPARGGQAGKRPCGLLPVEKIRRRDALLEARVVCVRLPQDGQALGLQKGERAPENGVHDRIDGRRRADPERQRRDGDRREPGVAEERPEAEPKALQQSRHELSPPSERSSGRRGPRAAPEGVWRGPRPPRAASRRRSSPGVPRAPRRRAVPRPGAKPVSRGGTPRRGRPRPGRRPASEPVAGSPKCWLRAPSGPRSHGGLRPRAARAFRRGRLPPELPLPRRRARRASR